MSCYSMGLFGAITGGLYLYIAWRVFVRGRK